MSPPIPPQWADISTWTDVNGGGDGAQRGAIPKGIEHGRVSPALWHGGPLPCRTVAMRWPDGFVCPKCASTKYSYCEPKRLFQCTACRLQTSVRSGTIFHKSHMPLTKWFLAMHLMTSAKNDIAALELARQLDVKWDT